jgi:hypothetical protein
VASGVRAWVTRCSSAGRPALVDQARNVSTVEEMAGPGRGCSARDLLRPCGALSGVASAGALLALVIGFSLPLEKYSWMGSPEIARIIDPDSLLVATSMSIVAIVLAAVAIWLSRRRGRLFPGVVLVLSVLLGGRLLYIYAFTPELIWHQ